MKSPEYRDAFVALLKAQIDTWLKDGFNMNHHETSLELRILVAKTQAFLRDEFDE